MSTRLISMAFVATNEIIERMAKNSTDMFININRDELMKKSPEDFAVLYYDYYVKMLKSIQKHVLEQERGRLEAFGSSSMEKAVGFNSDEFGTNLQGFGSVPKR